MGMTHADYWDGDPTLVCVYRKAERIRQDNMNTRLWLQGMYFYEAICDAAPLLHAFGKKGTKAHEYSKHPYDLHPDETARKEQRKVEKATELKGLAFMKRFMAAHNSKRHPGGESDAHD